MNKSSIEAAWNALIRAIAALPFAVAIWLLFLLGSLQVLRPIVELVSRVFLGQTISGLTSAGYFEWTLQTNLAFVDKPSQLYEFPLQPQYFMLPFPLLWAGVWACAPAGKKASCLLIASTLALGTILIPLLLQVISAAPFAAYSIGLDTVVTRDFAGRIVVQTYNPVPLVAVQLMGFARTIIVHLNLFVLPPLLSVLCSDMLSRSPAAERRRAVRPKNARRKA